ncbi:chromate efflux transporter [Chitiniphilus eburneus]|uniref:Chromate efflux transporter n=1 Tax=Chitiniphilus eburneus TaxID=2571148 RepID=A0A4U0Q586_9NEIS|nr:chromate efflux transporter [Chitiniphilus eburneus]TJZ76239.1 chromate efflux transporter [Chitiniphilus eburneus]
MPHPAPRHPDRPWAVFLVFLRLGLTSFGGPVAHLGYFRDEFVARRGWLDDRAYADLVALCQFLPGPASSQVGMALGLGCAGFGGALAAWAGFTLPSALLLALFALGLDAWPALVPPGALHGLKVVAVAVVAQAVWGMARQLCTDAPRVVLALCAAALALALPGVWGQFAAMLLAAAIGAVCWRARVEQGVSLPVPLGRRLGAGLLGVFAVALLGLPLVLHYWPSHTLALVDAFYRTGALVFGGGHVVLPLLQAAVVPNGWVSNDTFLAGYGAAQAVPGPLFTFAAFLGAAMTTPPTGWAGAMLCLAAIFAPSFLLVAGTLPFWSRLVAYPLARGALAGANAAVVGLLLAAFCHPVWTSAILRPLDAVVATAALWALMRWRWPPWRVVLGCALVGAALG